MVFTILLVFTLISSLRVKIRTKSNKDLLFVRRMYVHRQLVNIVFQSFYLNNSLSTAQVD